MNLATREKRASLLQIVYQIVTAVIPTLTNMFAVALYVERLALLRTLHEGGVAPHVCNKKGALTMGNLARAYATVLGAVLLLVGILGFVPALAPNGNLLGLFAIDPIHNLIHILSGVVGLVVAFSAKGAYSRYYALIFGIVYGLVTVIGFIQGTTVLGLIHVNLYDNLLHTLITLASLGVFFATGKSATNMRPSAA